jgi:predicted enzyme related to lactoylglutathione lyase
VAAARAGPIELPPLVQPASTDHHAGKVIWMDLATSDLAGAKHFYGGLLGWTFQEVPGARPPLRIAFTDGEPVAGLVQPEPPRSGRPQPAWLPFIATPDLASLKQQAVARGARVLSPPRSYPARGEQAVFADPQGAVFGALQSSSGDPPDVLEDPDEWIWSSLLTTSPRSAAAFYAALFGYEVHDLPANESSVHLLLASEGYARASVNELPPDAPKGYPYWLPFVRVLDTKAAVEKAKTLGGSVLSEPHPDRHGEMVAVIADPQGAPFGLMEWVETATANPNTTEPQK